MPDQTELELARFWDALETDPTGAETVDSSLAGVVRGFTRSSDSAPDPDPTFVTQLWEDLMNAHAIGETLSPPAMPGNPANAGGSRYRPAHLPVAPLNRRRLTLIAAALLLAAIGGIASIYLFDRGDQSHTAGPAIEAPDPHSATASPEAQALLDVTLPAEMLPISSTVNAIFASHTLQPHTRGTWETLCCSGPMIEYVLSGTYTVHPQYQIQVIRADGSRETISPDAVATLEAGDALLTEIRAKMESANEQDTPVEILTWYLVRDPQNTFGDKVFPGWTLNKDDFEQGIDRIAVPVRLTLNLLTLEPDAALPHPAGTIQLALTPLGQSGYITRDEDAITAISFDGTPVKIYLLTLTPEEPPASPAP